jgi:pilus assembly protein CpaB
MRRGRLFLLLIFLIILLGAGALVVYMTVLAPQPQAQVTPTPIPQKKVIVTTQNLSAGDVINATVLATIPWPDSGDFTQLYLDGSQAELVGRQLKSDLVAGSPIFKNNLLSEGERITMSGSTWALNVPPGMVAVSIPINRLSSVSYAPRPGDHVDVIVTVLFIDLDTSFQSMLPNLSGLVLASGPPNPETLEQDPLTVEITPGVYGRAEIDPVLGQAVFVMPIEAQRPRMSSQMLLQNAMVLQIGDFPLPGQATTQQAEAQPTPAAGRPAQEQQEAPEPVLPVVVTLIVSPQDAVTLNYLMFSGAKLTLALRNPRDTTTLQINSVTLDFVIGQYGIQVPARLPYGLHPRMDDLVLPTLEVEEE